MDAAGADAVRRAPLVPVLGRAARTVDGIPLVASRTGYSGELGYELFCHPKDAPALWDAILEAGAPHGLTPLGLDALDMLRIEAGLIFAGYEFDDQVDPFEAGIGFTVDRGQGRRLRRPRGARAARRIRSGRSSGSSSRGTRPPATATASTSAAQQVGVVTSGTRCPILKKNIALGRMAVQYAALGTEVEVGKLDGHQKRIPATVVRSPVLRPREDEAALVPP